MGSDRVHATGNSRVAEALRDLKREYDAELERLKAEEPDWAAELLNRLK